MLILACPQTTRADKLKGKADLFLNRIQARHLKRGWTPVIVKIQADLTPEHDVWATVMQSGLISRAPADKTPKFSGEAAPLAVVQATSRDILYLVTLKGRAVSVPVHSAPEKEDPQEGTPWQSVSALDGPTTSSGP